MLAGEVCKAPETRVNPAGIPLARFTLEHRSLQLEAGMEREARCRIIVIAAGKELAKQASALSVEQSVKVSGFITRSDNRTGQAMLVLHAQQLETLG